jgi:hypothetical protein
VKSQVKAFERFHGIEPDSYEEKRLWVPGGLVYMGPAIDTGYRVVTRDSEKTENQEYVHDHKDGVKLWRRPRGRENPDKRMRPPRTCWLLGVWLGCTYLHRDGRKKEIGGRRLKAIAPNEKILFALGPKGVEYVIMGGKFRITDWMYD